MGIIEKVYVLPFHSMSSYIERQTNSRTQTNALQSKKFRNNKENASEIRKTFTSYSILFASNHLHQFMAEFFFPKNLQRGRLRQTECYA